jgi:DNA polymerase-3 subunit gamma/tau
LETVKQERRVAWMLLSNASVLSLEDGILTLRFPRDGDVKGFSVSGHDAVLKRVLSERFGLSVTIKGVAGGQAAGPAARPARPGQGNPGPGNPGPGQPGASRPPASRPEPPPSPAPGPRPGSVPAAAAAPYDDLDGMPPGEIPPDEPSPDDQAIRDAELTGMDLIQRELGGRVIGEIDS